MSDLEILQNFIFNNETQNTLTQIQNSIMDFNIFEITGIGSKEIKYSNFIS